ncbi:receptor-like protein kinase FERONIA [Canna indica]|uniref:Receptor-like protein kinase FERONIA n=1 Tax=Canna indica TaxID=4628 RepID=A0AAQ3QEW9_9LILI|nr:receptor-like protein kinase FERONIA [Canna indica]
MKNRLIQLSALVCASFLSLLAAPAASSPPRDNILLSCGAAGPDSDANGRPWTSDAESEYAPSLNGRSYSAMQQASSVPRVPYLTARVFTSPYTYSFPLPTGRIFLRLHFYPSNFANHSAADAFFSVTAGPYTLLQNFSASLTADALSFAYLTREFSLNVSSGCLNITFAPSTTHKNSYAFINGIEIVPIPGIFSSSRPMLIHGGNPVEFEIDADQALQTVYRLNVGGQAISPVKDSGLSRTWEDDSPYIYGAASGVTFSNDPNVSIKYTPSVPNYIAPEEVYSTARSMGPNAHINLNYKLTWILPVDAGFYYLVRLHFCEIQYPITKENQRVFGVYLDNLTAQWAADVIGWSKGIGVPVFKDYVVITMGSGQTDLWVALHPQTISKPQYYDAILNGMEVFKLQNSDNSLAGVNPEPRPQPVEDPGKVSKQKEAKGHVAAIVGVVIGGGFAILLAGVYLSWMSKDKEMKAAAEDLDDESLLRHVGEIDGGTTKLEVKPGNPTSENGSHE